MRRCTVEARLSTEVGKELALVALDAPVECPTYDEGRPVSRLVLAPQGEGETLFSFALSPTYVSISIPTAAYAPEAGRITDRMLTAVDFGLAYSDEAAAVEMYAQGWHPRTLAARDRVLGLTESAEVLAMPEEMLRRLVAIGRLPVQTGPLGEPQFHGTELHALVKRLKGGG